MSAVVDFAEDGAATPRIRSATEVAGEMLRNLIGSGELAPGDRLHADELGRRLGVSRTPIRDALNQLRTEGLVDIQPRRGVFVRQISPQEIAEVYAIKQAVEPLAASWAADRATPSQRAELERLLDDLRAAGAADDVPRAADCVEAIHQALFRYAGSSALSDVFQVFSGRARALRQLNMAQTGRLAESLAQHTTLVERVVAGDSAGAEAAMRAHMADATQSALRVATDDQDSAR